jgi:hypothetical protein
MPQTKALAMQRKALEMKPSRWAVASYTVLCVVICSSINRIKLGSDAES